MNLRINIPPELEQVLQRRAAQAGLRVEDFVLEALSERLGTAPSSVSRDASLTVDQFAIWIDAWVKRFPVLEHPIDDSRESIYSGRGE